MLGFTKYIISIFFFQHIFSVVIMHINPVFKHLFIVVYAYPTLEISVIVQISTLNFSGSVNIQHLISVVSYIQVKRNKAQNTRRKTQ